MDASVIEGYIEKVYGYSIGHTYSRDEADELAQEILFTAVKELPKLRDESRFEPWLWGIAGNVTKRFRRNMGKQRAMYSYDTLENITYEDEYFDDREEVYASLRKKIAMLSSIYRDIVILYYYDGLSTKQISERLCIPEGTVTWRLSEARKKLKKECCDMETTALKPVKLGICMSGNGNYNGTTMPFPNAYISDALSQNILYHCYEQAKTVEELAKLCGVPAYYIEDSLANLIRREAVSEAVRGKYRTEFIIYSDKTDEYYKKAYVLFEDLTVPFVSAMTKLTEGVENIGIYTAEKVNDELIYLYGLMAIEHLYDRFNPIKTQGYKTRYDGNSWSYHAHLISGAKYRIRGLGKQLSANLGSHGTYSHTSYQFGGFSYRKMMYDNEINICEDLLSGKPIQDTESAASAIEKGYVLRRDTGLFVTVPAFTKEHHERFKSLVDDIFAAVIVDYAGAVKEYVDGYKKLFPTHLEDEVLLACNYLFLSLYATAVCDIAQKKGLLLPPRKGAICDVLIQLR
ncbi:MAG: RNA polymerase sigma factor [Clostridia bacterium]|nr:RNA polymerase sigma factor [Clostridia bacterium]